MFYKKSWQRALVVDAGQQNLAAYLQQVFSFEHCFCEKLDEVMHQWVPKEYYYRHIIELQRLAKEQPDSVNQYLNKHFFNLDYIAHVYGRLFSDKDNGLTLSRLINMGSQQFALANANHLVKALVQRELLLQADYQTVFAPLLKDAQVRDICSYSDEIPQNSINPPIINPEGDRVFFNGLIRFAKVCHKEKRETFTLLDYFNQFRTDSNQLQEFIQRIDDFDRTLPYYSQMVYLNPRHVGKDYSLIFNYLIDLKDVFLLNIIPMLTIKDVFHLLLTNKNLSKLLSSEKTSDFFQDQNKAEFPKIKSQTRCMITTSDNRVIALSDHPLVKYLQLNKLAYTFPITPMLSGLFRAIARNDVSGVKQLLNKKSVMVTNGRGTTEIKLVDFQRFQNTKTTKKQGANPYIFSPLQLACYHGHVEIIKLLLDQGADANLASGNNKPINFAILREDQEVIKRLLEAGNNTERSEKALSPLDFAIFNHKTKAAIALINNGAYVDNRHFILAITFNHLELAKQIAKLGHSTISDPQAQTYPAALSELLYRACMSASDETAEYLFNLGAHECEHIGYGVSHFAALIMKDFKIFKISDSFIRLLKNCIKRGLEIMVKSDNDNDDVYGVYQTISTNFHKIIDQVELDQEQQAQFIERYLEFSNQITQGEFYQITNENDLCISAKLRDTRILEKHLECGALPNQWSVVHGTYALHVACQYNNLPAIKLLLEKGAMQDLDDNQGKTAGEYLDPLNADYDEAISLFETLSPRKLI